MRNQRQHGAPQFCPKRRTKSLGPRRNGIMVKSLKELKMIQMRMKKPMNRNIEIRGGNLGSGSANPCQPKGSNVKRSRTLIINGSTHLAKSARKSNQHSNGIESLHPTQLKAMPSLVHKENTVDRLNQYKNSLPSGVEEPEGEVFSGKEKKLSHRSEAHAMCYRNSMREGSLKAKETPSSTSSVNGNQLIDEDTRRSSENKPTRMFSRDVSNFQRDKTPFMEDSKCALPSKLFDRGQLADCDNKTSNGKPKRSEPWLEGTSKKNDDSHSEGVVQLANQTSRPTKKQRRLVIIEDGDEQAIGGVKDHNHVFVEDGTTRSKPQDTILNHCHDKAPISLCIEQQCHRCSKPIDEPIWRGLIKICGKKYISLDGHLSTRCGKKVWELSRSLLPVVEVTKHSRVEAWPKRWETSKPSGNDIGIYFFPHEKRPNEELDQLVKEVIENDLVLRAVISEAEMLIFPSILLPKRYQTFQTKYYLWGVFKPREDKGAVIAEAVNATRLCAKEVEKEIDDVSRQKDVLMKTTISLESHRVPAKSTQEVRASHVQEPSSRDLEHKAPKEDMQGDALHHAMHTAIANTIGVDDPIISSKDVPVNPHTGLPPSTIYGFAVAQTPKVMQLIREMEREGAVVVALQGR